VSIGAWMIGMVRRSNRLIIVLRRAV
jgi:hypothetical protein